uniref:Reverse transcriptase zinc-binding domain-containing protein n=1 Tax=Aegilops tauschii subsp. strangulata TaxID=200361 RepID=A0A453QK46_AEGTS
WRFTKNNIFSVRSAYYVEWDHQFARWYERTEGQPSQRHPIWANLWSFQVPAKIKIHAWKVLHGFIPCRGVLVNRHIGTEDSCPMCAGGCEDIMHSLFTCLRAAKIWSCLKLDKFIDEACLTDRAGTAALDYILCAPSRVSLI